MHKLMPCQHARLPVLEILHDSRRMTASSHLHLRRMIEGERCLPAPTRLDRVEIEARHLSRLRRRQVQADLAKFVRQDLILRRWSLTDGRGYVNKVLPLGTTLMFRLRSQAAQTQSSKSSEAQTSAGLSRNDQTIDHARIGKSTTNTLRPSQISAETYKSKEYAYGPKASKNNGAPPLSNEGARHMSGPGPAIHPPLNLNSRRMAASPPPPTRPLMDIPPQMPGPNPQSGFFAPNGSSMSAREGDSYRPDPPTRDAWLNNSRSPVSSPSLCCQTSAQTRYPIGRPRLWFQARSCFKVSVGAARADPGYEKRRSVI